ncbi:selenium metabolism-associated LysR family transcriptional regulator [Thermodesulfobacteriota bacterium]
MDLWQLQIFCKVVEQKSFSKAGRIVHLSQPTISSHIKDLEEYFDCRLVDRLAREAVPTKAGQILYNYARRLIALKDEAVTAVAEFQGKIKGRLEIGGSTIPGGYILPRIVGDFKKDYPAVTISLIIGDTEKIINDTLSGLLEFGVVGAKSNNKSLLQEKLMEDEMRLIIPADHKWARKKHIKLEMLLNEPFIVRESGSGTLKSMQNSLQGKGYSFDDFNIIAEMGNTAAVVQAILSKVGVSILSPIAVIDALSAGSLKALTIEGINLRRSFYLTRHKHRSPSPIGQAFINFLKEKLPASLLSTQSI